MFLSLGSTLDTSNDHDSPFSKEMSPDNHNFKGTLSSFPSFKPDNLQFIPEEPNSLSESIPQLNDIPYSSFPMELHLNFNPETQNLHSNPFLVYQNNDFREINQKDGYLHFWSRFKPITKHHTPLKYMLCVTVFSESFYELERTLTGIYKNVGVFKESGVSEHQICVVVIFDGIKAISPDIRQKVFNKLDSDNQIPEFRRLNKREDVFLNDLDQISRDLPHKLPINSCYVYEWNYVPDEEIHPKFSMKTLLAVKLQNASKMSSIIWFFRGFCEVLTPQYCGLLDCGTLPAEQAIFKMFMAFEADEDIGGLCGLMLPKCPVVYEESDKEIFKKGHWFIQFFYKIFDLKSSQIFEYGLGHMIDKCFESVLGFMYVLPGAFCSFRWEALCKDEKDLKSNFLDRKFVKIISDSNYKTSKEFTLAEGNLCQAEDQVISFDIVTKTNCKYKTKYLPDALAWTDPVKTFPVMMKQRKRWINGSWFAFQLTLGVFFEKMNKTLHHPIRKFGFYCYMFYMIGQNINRYLILSYIFGLFHIMSQEFLSEYYSNYIPMLNAQMLYLVYFLGCLYLIYYNSVVYKADKAIEKFQCLATLFGFSVHFFTIILIFRLYGTLKLQNYAKQDEQHIDIRFIYTFVGFNGVYYILPLLLNLKTCGWDMMKNGLAFFYHFPLYMIFFQIYAFCNIDDLTWGTKAKENLVLGAKIANNRIINAKFVGKWLLINFLVGFLIMIFTSNISFRVFLILGLGFIYTLMAMFKLFGAVIFKLKYDFFDLRRILNKNSLNKVRYGKESEDILKALEGYPQIFDKKLGVENVL